MKSKNTQIKFFLITILLLPFFAMSQNLSVKRQIVDGALKCGYVDKTGKIVIALKFGQAENFIDDLAIVSENSSSPNSRSGKKKLINLKGEYISNEEFGFAINIGKGLIKIGTDNNSGDINYGLLDKNGKIIVPIGEYQSFGNPSEGLIVVCNNVGCGAIDYNGSIKIEVQNKYGLIGEFQFGVIRINGKVRFQEGLMDKAGKVVLDPLVNKFEIVGAEGSDGSKLFNKSKVALIRKENKYGLVNSSGKVIVEPIYTRNNGLTDSGIKLSRMFESKLVTDTFNSQGIKQ